MIDPPPSKGNGDEDGHHGGVVGAADGSSVRTTLNSFSECFIIGPGQKVSPQPPMSPPSMGPAPELQRQKLLLPADNGAPPAPAAGSHQGPAVAAVEFGAQLAPVNGNGIIHHPTTLCRCGLTEQEKEAKRCFNVDCTQFKHAENQVSLLKGKEIYGPDTFDCATLTITAQNGEVHKAGWATHATSDAKSLTQETKEDLRNVSCSEFKQATYFVENKGSVIKGKGTSGPDSLCDCVTLKKKAGNELKDTGKAAQSTNDSYLTQFFVKVEKEILSMQKDLNTTTVKELIEYACYKAGVKAYDVYATYGGKPLKDDKFIACYPIFRDSTIHIRSRARAGRNDEFDFETFGNLMNKNRHKRFHKVTLSQLTTNANHAHGTVTFLSRFSAYYIHKILVFVCGKHREKKSFNGEFEIEHILIVNRTMVQFDSSLREYTFSETTCSNDYAKLFAIFKAEFKDNGRYPQYFEDLLNYLFLCPAKDKSNSEPLIQFLTNHPALTSYADRIKQCIILDSMAHRLDLTGKRNLDKVVGTFASWKGNVRLTPALENVYLYKSYHHPITTQLVVNAEYTSQGLGCVHFSKNYFIHADYQVKLEEAEAAFAQTLDKFLPETLLKIATDYTTAPAGFDILTLLGNSLADPSTGK